MPTVSSVALGGLQVVALLAAVVVAASRMLIASLEPTPENDWLRKVIAYSGIISLTVLSVAAICFTAGLMGAYGMPPLIDLAFILLLIGLSAFATPMALLVYLKREEGKLPTLDPPR